MCFVNCTCFRVLVLVSCMLFSGRLSGFHFSGEPQNTKGRPGVSSLPFSEQELYGWTCIWVNPHNRSTRIWSGAPVCDLFTYRTTCLHTGLVCP
uniref:Putative secreted protein n=1 Tax=Ixodes ricinus TaxID=34613 RepID=A0A6B0U8S5_IXORI